MICFANAIARPSWLMELIGVTGIDGSGGKKWLGGADVGDAGVVSELGAAVRA